MAITLNLAGVQTELEAVPAGNYACTISSAVEGVSKTNNPKIEVKLRIDEPEEYAGRILFDNFSLQPQALWKLKRFLLVLGYTEEDLGDGFVLEPDEMVGLDCVASVIVKPFIRNQGTEAEETVERNNIAAYSPADAHVGIESADDDDDGGAGFDFDFD